jgi:hypothetical protein
MGFSAMLAEEYILIFLTPRLVCSFEMCAGVPTIEMKIFYPRWFVSNGWSGIFFLLFACKIYGVKQILK